MQVGFSSHSLYKKPSQIQFTGLRLDFTRDEGGVPVIMVGDTPKRGTQKVDSADFQHEKRLELLGLKPGEEEKAQKIHEALQETVLEHEGTAISGQTLLKCLQQAQKQGFWKKYFKVSGIGWGGGILLALANLVFPGVPLGIAAFCTAIFQIAGLGMGGDEFMFLKANKAIRNLPVPVKLSTREVEAMSEKLLSAVARFHELGLVSSVNPTHLQFTKQGKKVLRNYGAYHSQMVTGLPVDQAIAFISSEQSQQTTPPSAVTVPASASDSINLETSRKHLEEQIQALLRDQANCQSELEEAQATYRQHQESLAANQANSLQLEQAIAGANDPLEAQKKHRELQRLKNELTEEQELGNLHALFLKTLEEKTPGMIEDIQDTISQIRINLTQIAKIKLAQKTLEAAKSMEEKKQFDAQVAVLIREINHLQHTVKTMLDAENLDAKLLAMTMVKEKLAEIELVKSTLTVPQTQSGSSEVLAVIRQRVAENEARGISQATQTARV